MPKPHIAYLADGRNYHIQKWLPAIAEQGFDVTLLTFRPPEAEIPGVSVHVLSTLVGTSENLKYINFWLSAGRVREALRQLDVDLLIGSYATHYGWLAACTNFHPFVLQTWTADLTINPFLGLKRFVLGPMVRHAIRAADLVTTDGEALKKMGEQLHPKLFAKNKPLATRWGIRQTDYQFTDNFRAEARRKLAVDPVMIVVTSPRGLQDWYRPGVVLPTLLKFATDSDNVKVVVLTLGHIRDDAIQQQLDLIEKSDQFVLLDRFLPSTEMKEVWAATDILVSVPKTDGISESVLEGIYSGVIPILSDIPSNRSLEEDGVRALFVNEPLEKNLSLVLLDAIKNVASLKERFSDSNKEWVAENASVEQTAELLGNELRRLIRAHKVT